jgi:hypothetical protein
MMFFYGTREYKIAILSERQKMNRAYFIECMLRPSTEICHPQSRGTHERRVMLHFGNVPLQNIEGVQESLANFGFRRIDHLLIVRIQRHVTYFFSVQ